MGKVLIIGGIVLIVFELVFMDKLGPLGKLPGDLSFSNGNMSFYFPITTSIVVSIIASIVFWLLQK